jgi:hypothetical protein
VSYICPKNHQNDRFCLKFFDISLIEKIEAPSLIEAPPREQSKNRSLEAYIRINTVCHVRTFLTTQYLRMRSYVLHGTG